MTQLGIRSAPMPNSRFGRLGFFVLASLAAALAYALLPDARLAPLVPVMAVFRSLMAGCVGGLLVPPQSDRWTAPAAVTAGIAIGTAATSLIAPGHVVYGAAVVGLGLGAGVALLFSWLVSLNKTVVAEVLALAAVVFVLVWCSGLLPGALRQTDAAQLRRAALSAEPRPGHYSHDGDDFLRTYYLMKRGTSYYVAFLRGINDDSRFSQYAGHLVLTSPFNYREPFIFYLWQVLPGSTGMSLFGWFVAFAALVLVCSYVLASSLVARGVALLAPIALLGWFFEFLWDPLRIFLLIEVWAGGLALAAVMCLIRKWWIPSLILLIAGVAAREFVVLLIPAWLLAWWVLPDRRSRWWFPTAAVLGPASVLGAHFLALPAAAFGGGGGVGAWMHGGPAALLAAVRFGWGAVRGGRWLSPVIAAAAVLGAALAQPRWRMLSLTAATVLPTCFLLAFSNGGIHWGSFYTPLAVSIAPALLGRLLPAETPDDGVAADNESRAHPA